MRGTFRVINFLVLISSKIGVGGGYLFLLSSDCYYNKNMIVLVSLVGYNLDLCSLFIDIYIYAYVCKLTLVDW